MGNPETNTELKEAKEVASKGEKAFDHLHNEKMRKGLIDINVLAKQEDRILKAIEKNIENPRHANGTFMFEFNPRYDSKYRALSIISNYDHNLRWGKNRKLEVEKKAATRRLAQAKTLEKILKELQEDPIKTLKTYQEIELAEKLETAKTEYVKYYDELTQLSEENSDLKGKVFAVKKRTTLFVKQQKILDKLHQAENQYHSVIISAMRTLLEKSLSKRDETLKTASKSRKKIQSDPLKA